MAFPNSRIRKRSRGTSSAFSMNPKSENKISRLLRLRRFGRASGACSDLELSGNEVEERYSRRNSSDLWNPRNLQIVLIPGSRLNSDATGCLVRGTDRPGVPGLSHHCLFSTRAGTLRVLAAAFGVLTVVAVIWMLSPDVLYTPYLDAASILSSSNSLGRATLFPLCRPSTKSTSKILTERSVTAYSGLYG
jgi:hypothetical protein